MKPYWNDKSFNAGLFVEATIMDTLKDMMNDTKIFDRVEPETLIVLARPKKILNEWRFFVADRDVIGCSQYNKNRQKHYEEGCPDEVMSFVNNIVKAPICPGYPMPFRWQPDWAYSVDIGECDGKFYIIEIGCLNCSDMYAMNKREVLKALKEKWEKKSGFERIVKRMEK